MRRRISALSASRSARLALLSFPLPSSPDAYGDDYLFPDFSANARREEFLDSKFSLSLLLGAGLLSRSSFELYTNLWYTPLSSSALLLISYCRSWSLQRAANFTTSRFCSIGAIFKALMKNWSTSDIVELKGAKMRDLELLFLNISFIESRFSSVKQSHGSSSRWTCSFLLNRCGLL